MNQKLLIPIIWFASLFTKGIYLYIALKEGAPTTERVTETIIILFILGTVISSAGIFISRKMYRDAKLYDSVFLKRLLKRSYARNQPTAGEIFFQVFVVVNGLFESTALFGLVGFLMERNLQFLITMNIISLAGWAYHRPRYSQFQELVGTSEEGTP